MKYYFSILCLFFALMLSAQDNVKTSSAGPSTQDSDSIVTDSIDRYSQTAFRLFSPINYDKAVTDKFFSIGEDSTSLIDRTQMKTFLHHPGQVQGSVDRFSKIENQENKVLSPDRQVKMVDQMKNIGQEIPTVSDTSKIDAVELYVSRPNFWTFGGDYNLQFMQNFVTANWYSGGNSNYSMLGVVTLQYNYNNKQRLKWDNKLEMRLGFLSTASDSVNTFKASDDLIRFTTQLSLRAHGHWYYAMQTIASTQFTKGLKDNDATVYSDFMSPFNLNVSLGMNYNVSTKNKKLTGDILVAPVSYKLTYCDRLGIATRFGIEEGRHSLHNIGSLINASLTWKPLERFKWESRFYTYTNYKLVQIEWENTMTFQFNRYISSKLYIYPRFDNSSDDTDYSPWQFKENFSAGFTYTM